MSASCAIYCPPSISPAIPPSLPRSPKPAPTLRDNRSIACAVARPCAPQQKPPRTRSWQRWPGMACSALEPSGPHGAAFSNALELAMDPKIKRALSAIAIEHPFFAALALRKPWIADPDLDPPTMATLPREYRYHPDFVAACSMPEILGVELHEVLHDALDHGILITEHQLDQ